VLRVACCVLRVACCVLRVACVARYIDDDHATHVLPHTNMIGTDFSSKRDQNRCSPTPPVGLHWDTSRAQKHDRIQFNNSTVIAAAAPYRI
jgi:hypothetical protein